MVVDCDVATTIKSSTKVESLSSAKLIEPRYW